MVKSMFPLARCSTSAFAESCVEKEDGDAELIFRHQFGLWRPFVAPVRDWMKSLGVREDRLCNSIQKTFTKHGK